MRDNSAWAFNASLFSASFILFAIVVPGCRSSVVSPPTVSPPTSQPDKDVNAVDIAWLWVQGQHWATLQHRWHDESEYRDLVDYRVWGTPAKPMVEVRRYRQIHSNRYQSAVWLTDEPEDVHASYVHGVLTFQYGNPGDHFFSVTALQPSPDGKGRCEYRDSFGDNITVLLESNPLPLPIRSAIAHRVVEPGPPAETAPWDIP